MVCKHCGKELPSGAKFCSGCGSPVEEQELNVQSGEVISEQADGKTELLETDPAGAVLVEAAPTALETQPEEAPILTGKRSRGRLFLFIALAVAAVAVVFVAIKLIGGIAGGSVKPTYVYLNDDEELMLLSGLSEKSTSTEIDDHGAYNVQFSDDGKTIYFSTDEGSLYFVEASKVGKDGVEPEKISSDAYEWYTTDGGVVYRKEDQYRFFNGTESIKLAKDEDYSIYSTKVSDGYFYYRQTCEDDYSECDVYRIKMTADAQKEKLLSGAYTVYNSLDSDLLVFSRKNDNNEYAYAENQIGGGGDTFDLYTAKPGGEKNKILSDVANVSNVDVSGGKVSFSYTKYASEEICLYDYVTDTLRESDALVQEPDQSDYQTYVPGRWYSYYSTDWDAYYDARNEWYDAKNRNELRERLQNEPVILVSQELYEYKDGKENKLADGISYIKYKSDGVYIYEKYQLPESSVADISEIYGMWEVYNSLDDDQKLYSCVNGTENEFDIGEDYALQSVYSVGENELVLCISEYSESYSDDDSMLWSYSVGKDKLTKTGTLTEDDFVIVGNRKVNDKSAFYYYENLDSDRECGDVVRYVDGKKTTLAKEVYGLLALDEKTMVAFTDRGKDGSYTLSMVSGENRTKIGDDVSDYEIIDAKTVLYISDRDLYYWDGSKSVRLASDVMYIWCSNAADVTRIQMWY